MGNKKDEIIKSIMLKLQDIGDDLREDSKTCAYDKIDQMDVLLDTMHFLQDYDENVKVLNDYWVAKHRKEKFKQVPDEK